MKNYPKTFKYKVIDTITVPHPYCITPGHIGFASDNYSGLLNGEAITAYETKMMHGCCGVKGCQLTYAEHEQAAFIQVDFPGKLSDAPGLESYLKDCLPNAEKLNHAGFVFIQKEKND